MDDHTWGKLRGLPLFQLKKNILRIAIQKIIKIINDSANEKTCKIHMMGPPNPRVHTHSTTRRVAFPGHINAHYHGQEKRDLTSAKKIPPKSGLNEQHWVYEDQQDKPL